MVKLLFFHFRVTNWNLKDITLRVTNPIPADLEIQFYLCPVPHEFHQGKLVYFCGHPLNQVIFTS